MAPSEYLASPTIAGWKTSNGLPIGLRGSVEEKMTQGLGVTGNEASAFTAEGFNLPVVAASGGKIVVGNQVTFGFQHPEVFVFCLSQGNLLDLTEAMCGYGKQPYDACVKIGDVQLLGHRMYHTYPVDTQSHIMYYDPRRWRPPLFGPDDLLFPRTFPEFQRLFPDDLACAAYFEAIRWRDGFRCGWCNEPGEPYRFANPPHVLRCRKCKRDNRLTAGTIMQDTPTLLSVWF
jgi:Transposase zinc-ribbon domain